MTDYCYSTWPVKHWMNNADALPYSCTGWFRLSEILCSIWKASNIPFWASFLSWLVSCWFFYCVKCINNERIAWEVFLFEQKIYHTHCSAMNPASLSRWWQWGCPQTPLVAAQSSGLTSPLAGCSVVPTHVTWAPKTLVPAVKSCPVNISPACYASPWDSSLRFSAVGVVSYPGKPALLWRSISAPNQHIYLSISWENLLTHTVTFGDNVLLAYSIAHFKPYPWCDIQCTLNVHAAQAWLHVRSRRACCYKQADKLTVHSDIQLNRICLQPAEHRC